MKNLKIILSVANLRVERNGTVILDADLAELHKTDPEMAAEFQKRVDAARERLKKSES